LKYELYAGETQTNPAIFLKYKKEDLYLGYIL
jgi:hypothetical protein